MLRQFGLYLVLALFGSVATASAAVVNDVDIATGWTKVPGPLAVTSPSTRSMVE